MGGREKSSWRPDERWRWKRGHRGEKGKSGESGANLRDSRGLQKKERRRLGEVLRDGRGSNIPIPSTFSSTQRTASCPSEGRGSGTRGGPSRDTTCADLDTLDALDD
jgi:hypothetical protein